ncbi:restriction endonuclease subunit S [Vibrio campbellii]|uniref:restriction endonuclease subunit S n=1 Tax=Vibrio campbellii TaxID=680 RepID=UPI00215C9343|nr:restriction endonuclease subunit S [Vibrio campbellii]MCR9910313.1 restriction endonuclease subunit S [Vibrio campbellii]
MQESQLPKEWVTCSLGEVLELKYGKALPQKVRDGGEYPVFGSNGVVGSHSFPLVDGQGLIIGRKGSYGEIHASEEPFFPIDTTYFVDDFSGQPLRYWYYQLKKLPLKELNRATAIPGLNRNDAYEQQVVVPPAAEQQVIADKLDIWFGQVGNVKSRLENVLDTIKEYRRSVLLSAVNGELTEAWRSSEKQWQEMPLEKLASNIVDCPHSTPKWSKVGKYCVRTTAFTPFYLDLSKQGFVSEEVYQDRIQRLKPLPGDILYSREGTVGIACQIPLGVELCLGQRMVLIRAGEECSAKYLTIVLNSDKILDDVRSKCVGSTVPRINMKDIRKFSIPLPSINEQEEIVRCVEELFSYGKKLEERVNSAISQIDDLNNSILNAAFNGELTSKWRHLNPMLIRGSNSSDELLRNINKQRELSKNKTKSLATKIKKKTTMKKINSREVNEWVVKHQEPTFTFEYLLKSIGGEYEQVKDSVFSALSSKDALFKQCFDEKTGKIIFVKEKV